MVSRRLADRVSVNSNRLLVIDDEPAISAAIGRIARCCGYDAIITTDAEDFLSKFGTWDPRFIVIGLAVPEMAGNQLMAWLAKADCKAQILIVSEHKVGLLKEAEAAGRALGLNIAGTVHKPLRLDALKSALQDIYDAGGVLSVQDITTALANREIRLAYQPQIDLLSGAVVGFEGLARWSHPKRGAIPPDAFIPLLEANEFMTEFTGQMVTMALDDIHHLNEAPNARVAINVSATDRGSKGMDEMVRAQCAKKGISVNRITLEVTETAVMSKAGLLSGCLTRLSQFGARLSVDDFGTGYSSLVKLHQLPFSELKIDKSFVMDCVSNRESGVLVQAMIGLAHNLHMKVVAEGVETEEVMERLREWGCDIAQGYFIARPMPPKDLQSWLEHNASRMRYLRKIEPRLELVH
jgi:EAL domain-containing protein (putative c-di-GMP-specific phosphodiesterase class I)/CheY-like chemotaxis protein